MCVGVYIFIIYGLMFNVITQNYIVINYTNNTRHILRFDLHFFSKTNTLTQSLGIVIERKNV